MTDYGYARVSTRDQNCAIQVSALRAAGCDVIREEKASGAKVRPALTALLGELQKGDTLTVFKLDRLGRSLRHLLSTIADLDARGVTVRFIKDSIDLSTPTGRLLLHVLGAVAEFERELILERTAAGIAAAEARGSRRGRPPKDLEAPQVVEALRMRSEGLSTARITRAMGMSKATLYRWIAESNARNPPF
jgi:DNA invertase Pin-like site-specific DNA recombinase